MKAKSSSLVKVLLIPVYIFGILLSYIFIEACSKNTEWADFRLFWGVGRALTHGKVDLVYPEFSQFTFNQTIFNDGVPFLYPPNFATFSVIFSPLPMETSYALTRIFLVLVLVATAFIYFRFLKVEDGDACPSLLYFFLPPLLFFPVAESIGIGQLSIFLYLFPVVVSLVSVLSGRYLLAGLVLGLVFLKPQPMPGLFWVFGCFFLFGSRNQKDWYRFFGGLAFMGLLNLLLALSFFGFDGILRWLHGARVWMGSYVWGSLEYYEPYWLIASVPMALGRLWRDLFPGNFSPALPQVISGFVYLVEALVIYSISRSQCLSFRQKLEAAICFAVFSLPVAAPYMRVYDLSVFLAPFWIVFFGSVRNLPGGKLLLAASISVIVFIDCHLLLVPQQMAHHFQYGNLVVSFACLFAWLASLYLCLANSAKSKSAA